MLNYYIQKDDKDKVLEVCEQYGRNANDANNGDLWIQALTYFRELEDIDEAQQYLEKALNSIGEEKILSPLLVLEIISGRSQLKFKVLKNYL